MKYFFDNIQKFGIKELRDGLTLEIINEKFSWILEAKIKDAILGINSDNTTLIFYDGIWKDGTWFSCCSHEGKWKDGLWKGGTWENGIVF